MNLLLTVNEAATRYKVPGDTIRTWLFAGKLTRYEVKGAVCVDNAEMQAMTERKCPVCLNPFTPTNTRQRFCSQRCRQKNNRNPC